MKKLIISNCQRIQGQVEFDFQGISFLVGPNNSGKGVVKDVLNFVSQIGVTNQGFASFKQTIGCAGRAEDTENEERLSYRSDPIFRKFKADSSKLAPPEDDFGSFVNNVQTIEYGDFFSNRERWWGLEADQTTWGIYSKQTIDKAINLFAPDFSKFHLPEMGIPNDRPPEIFLDEEKEKAYLTLLDAKRKRDLNPLNKSLLEKEYSVGIEGVNGEDIFRLFLEVEGVVFFSVTCGTERRKRVLNDEYEGAYWLSQINSLFLDLNVIASITHLPAEWDDENATGFLEDFSDFLVAVEFPGEEETALVPVNNPDRTSGFDEGLFPWIGEKFFVFQGGKLCTNNFDLGASRLFFGPSLQLSLDGAPEELQSTLESLNRYIKQLLAFSACLWKHIQFDATVDGNRSLPSLERLVGYFQPQWNAGHLWSSPDIDDDGVVQIQKLKRMQQACDDDPLLTQVLTDCFLRLPVITTMIKDLPLPEPNPDYPWEIRAKELVETHLASLSKNSILDKVNSFFELLSESDAPHLSAEFRILDGLIDSHEPSASNLVNVRLSNFEVKLILNAAGCKNVDFSSVGSAYGYLLPVAFALTSPDFHYGLNSFTHFKSMMIEQPELHLHPKMQGALGSYIFKNNLHNSESIFIETHSENIILRLLACIRKAYKKQSFSLNALNEEDETFDYSSLLRFYYFEPLEGGRTEVHSLGISPSGEILGYWPDGFFEEKGEDLEQFL